MENRLKLRISRMFRSCRSRNLPDVIENTIFSPQNHKNLHIIETNLSSKARPFPSICKPRRSEAAEVIQHNCTINTKAVLPRRKVSERYSPFVWVDNTDGRTCPRASAISPSNQFCEIQKLGFNERLKISEKRKKKKKRNKKREIWPFSSSSQDRKFGGWFSSDDEKEDETETHFSSNSLSSDSSEYRRRGTHRRRAKMLASGMGVLLMEGKVKDSFAVVKKSSDPYNDFRTSMVEMIIEKQMFATKDLEQLLQCFLSLNSYHHHRIIVEVFTDIWEALFSNWS